MTRESPASVDERIEAAFTTLEKELCNVLADEAKAVRWMLENPGLVTRLRCLLATVKHRQLEAGLPENEGVEHSQRPRPTDPIAIVPKSVPDELWQAWVDFACAYTGADKAALAFVLPEELPLEEWLEKRLATRKDRED